MWSGALSGLIMVCQVHCHHFNNVVIDFIIMVTQNYQTNLVHTLSGLIHSWPRPSYIITVQGVAWRPWRYNYYDHCGVEEPVQNDCNQEYQDSPTSIIEPL